jgi:hypothetical protein
MRRARQGGAAAGFAEQSQVPLVRRSARLQAAQAMIERVEARFALAPERFVADTADDAPLLASWV